MLVILFAIFQISCSASNLDASKKSSQITWNDLQITAKDNNNLCTTISLDNEQDWERSKQDFNYGLLGEIRPKHISDTNKVADRTAWINANEQQSLTWRFWYPEGNDRSVNLRLFVLLDEHQLSNALPSSGIYNDIVLERGDDISLDVIIPPLESGIHDVIAIAVPYPEEYPNEYGIVTLVYWRITLIAEPTVSPFRKIDFSPMIAEGSINKNDPAMALELTLLKDGIDVWNWPNPWLDISGDTAINFFALIGHQDVTNLDTPNLDKLKTSFSSLLLFMDYQQIEIAPNQTVIYSRTENDTAYARIPITLPPPAAGKHQLLALRIDTPGVPMCILQGDPKSRILPNSVYGKLVGINVVP